MVSAIFKNRLFQEPGAEREFVQRNHRRKTKSRVFFMYAAPIAYAAHVILDFFVAGDHATLFILLRLCLVCPGMMFVAYLFNHHHRRFGTDNLICAYLMLPTLNVIYMCAVVEGMAADVYPFGVMIILYCCSAFILPSFRFMVRYSVVFLALFWAVFPYSSISFDAAVAHAFFQIMGTAVNIIGVYFLELTERRQHANEINLEEMISDLETSERNIRDLYHEAKKADRAKGEFLAVVSHELRTPMNAIIGFSEIISSEMLGKVQPVQYREYAQHIHSSGQQLLHIINDILDLSRAEMNKIEFVHREFDLSTAVRAAIVSCRENAREAGVSILQVEPFLHDVSVTGDEARIVQALVNIIGNGIKFSNTGGQVEVCTAFTVDGGMKLLVTDYGIGISPEDVEQIRKPFQQAESAFSRNTGGLGLGLAICSIIAEAHGGKLNIESTLGERTCVSLELPEVLVKAPKALDDTPDIGLAEIA